MRHINPFLYPVFRGSRERIDEEHEEQARVNADMIVADGADSIDIGAVNTADGGEGGWEYLEIPVNV